jgi:large subunit ribosomal protein L10
MPTAEKEQAVRDLSEQLKGARGVYLADFTGMSVEKASLLRRRCRESHVRFKVVKNTLLKRAMSANGVEALNEFMEGPTGVAYSTMDEVVPAKVLADFAKEFETLRIKAAIVEGKVLDAKEVKQLASLPGRDALLGMLLATMIAPLTQFLGAVDATLRLPAVMADVLERERQKG